MAIWRFPRRLCSKQGYFTKWKVRPKNATQYGFTYKISQNHFSILAHLICSGLVKNLGCCGGPGTTSDNVRFINDAK